MASFKQYALNNGNKCWKFQAYLGTHPVKGIPVKTTRSSFKTKKEAQIALALSRATIKCWFWAIENVGNYFTSFTFDSL